ncbi:unnamed protein product [Rotaria sp. Silwood1]|nr:unnamed protein product [Rotaria sp. Silwood1]
MSVTNNETVVDYGTTSKHNVQDKTNLREQAKSQFGFYNDILRGFDSYRQCLLHDESIIEFSRHLALAEIDTLHTDCKRVLNYVAENMSILGQSLPIKGRLVVCGLPRTSTTLLYNLLACDTNCRAPLYTYICIDMVPSIVISDSIQQQQRANTMLSSTKEIKHFADYQSQMAEAHPFLPIEEDYLILRHTSYLPFVTYIGIDNESDSDTWLQNEMSKHYACDYHETFLRMLN